MAWFGKITDFTQMDNSWLCSVDFYDDTNPNMIIPRSFTWPLSITRTQAIADIRAKGQEIRNQASINTAQIIGSVIPIP